MFILPVWPAYKYDYVLHSTATAHSRRPKWPEELPEEVNIL